MEIKNHHGIKIVLIFLFDIFTCQFAVLCNFAPKVVTYCAIMDGLSLGINSLDECAVFLFLIDLDSNVHIYTCVVNTMRAINLTLFVCKNVIPYCRLLACKCVTVQFCLMSTMRQNKTGNVLVT